MPMHAITLLLRQSCQDSRTIRPKLCRSFNELTIMEAEDTGKYDSWQRALKPLYMKSAFSDQNQG